MKIIYNIIVCLHICDLYFECGCTHPKTHELELKDVSREFVLFIPVGIEFKLR